MTLITISAIVKADGTFVFPPFGLPAKKSISVNQTSTSGQYQIIYDTVFEGLPVVTATPAWLGQYGSGGGSPLDGAVINELTKSFTTIKLGDSLGNSTWRPFTIVLTGQQALAG
ncbi:uncharacterized protein LACBIDRAFT_307172 [Laccaria bicolor S238N-H82]|uniref:Predicted protein n=1 Tax=Laccaria bicolor (strain S238N-H82 / ATCC MYA-4686) TaxID=486041 RepID=B0DPJ2_LACBS|nr:uncharacterized protein LACBIDRAFT_307172 [Laccaria bicolor S238N-H82]EDR03459.1 predicted protein [Laccaria bicolor S238N-H82]|eukprot:XP_001885915.1 predicted protein [Laccaria bicolor S238N-H82]